MHAYTITLDAAVREGLTGLASRNHHDGQRWGTLLVGDTPVPIHPDLVDGDGAVRIDDASIDATVTLAPRGPGDQGITVLVPGRVTATTGRADTLATSSELSRDLDIHASLVRAEPGAVIDVALTPNGRRARLHVDGSGVTCSPVD